MSDRLHGYLQRVIPAVLIASVLIGAKVYDVTQRPEHFDTPVVHQYLMSPDPFTEVAVLIFDYGDSQIAVGTLSGPAGTGPASEFGERLNIR